MTIEAPPSVLPPKKYCDITGLDAPYIDPKSRLRYHNAEVYAILKTFVRLPSLPFALRSLTRGPVGTGDGPVVSCSTRGAYHAPMTLVLVHTQSLCRLPQTHLRRCTM